MASASAGRSFIASPASQIADQQTSMERRCTGVREGGATADELARSKAPTAPARAWTMSIHIACGTRRYSTCARALRRAASSPISGVANLRLLIDDAGSQKIDGPRRMV